MMKTQLLIKMFMFTVVLTVTFDQSYAQDDFTPKDTVIAMKASMFTPSPDGYYLVGVDKDTDENGIDEHYSACDDEYGDADHKEDSTQNGWTYENVIVFRDCSLEANVVDDAVKGTPPTEDWPETGDFLQITKTKYAETDSMSFGYIVSPRFTNLKKLTVKTSTDLSINNSRQIAMMIEASTDDSVWQYIDNPNGTAFIHQLLANQGGDIFNYGDSANVGFDAIKALSETRAVRLRFLPFPSEIPALPVNEQGDRETGERINFWEIIIEAQTAAPIATVLSNRELLEESPFKIVNGNFVSNNKETLYVYRLSGALVGKGESVKIPNDKGLFVIKTSSGFAQKVFIK